jgi:hypothetical protein
MGEIESDEFFILELIDKVLEEISVESGEDEGMGFVPSPLLEQIIVVFTFFLRESCRKRKDVDIGCKEVDEYVEGDVSKVPLSLF